MCCWKRINFLELLIENLNCQTVANMINLHLINNNPDNNIVLEKLLVEFKNKYQKIKINCHNYDNKYFGFQRFLYIRDTLLENSNIKYIIIIDDDQLFSNDWVEKIYNLKESNSYIGWYGKKWDNDFDYWDGSIIKKKDLEENLKDDIVFVDYIGTGGSIIDINVFKNEKLYEIPEEIKNTVYCCEDLWLSFIVKYEYGWILKRSFLPIKECLNEKHKSSKSVSLWPGLKKEKQILLDYLINKYKK